MNSEAYLDIVWRQFKKNRPALWSLWFFCGLFVMAIFAPVIGSDRPLVFRHGDETLYPWLRSLFNPDEAVDYFFNMALLAFVPWVALSLVANAWLRRRGTPGRTRILATLVLYIGLTAAMSAVFWVDKLRPNNVHYSRVFTQEQFQSGGKARAWFVPIPFGPREQDLDSRFKPPFHRKEASQWRDSNDGFVHVLGTDDTGRDVLVEMIYGARISMTVGFVAVSIYLAIGIILGSLAGYFGGWWDILISRLIEIVLLFPAFFLILTLVALIGPSIYIIMVVIGLTGWPTVARLIRGEVLRQRAIDYVTAARALGAPHLRIIFRHILPNSIAPALVAAPFGIASAIITEASLSLLGFGVRPPTPSWGTLLRLANGNYSYWWLAVVPSLAIFVTATIFNLAGSGLRDAMDPRLRR